MRVRCRITRCADWLDEASIFGFCPSCQVAIGIGLGTGVGVATAFGFVFGVIDWLVRQ